jgi:hypothetical protein
MLRQYLYDQLQDEDPELPTGAEVLEQDLPVFHGRIAVHTSAAAVFYAPSELAGIGGMHRELIRSTSLWYGSYERRDTVLFQSSPDYGDILGGMLVGRVRRFVSFRHLNTRYAAALVEVFDVDGDEPDGLTGMWMLRPRKQGSQRQLKLIDIRKIWRACHIIGCYGQTRIPPAFHFSKTHIAFTRYYLNHFANYHAHECIPR